jgi:hypothetical protein
MSLFISFFGPDGYEKLDLHQPIGSTSTHMLSAGELFTELKSLGLDVTPNDGWQTLATKYARHLQKTERDAKAHVEMLRKEAEAKRAEGVAKTSRFFG